MFRKMVVLFLFIMCQTALQASGVRYTVVSSDGTSVRVAINIFPGTHPENNSYFGMLATDEAIGCTAVVRRPDGESRPVEWGAAGWMYGAWYRSFSFDAALFPTTDSAGVGELFLQFEHPVPRSRPSAADGRSVIDMSTSLPGKRRIALAKRSAMSSIPSVPFEHGLKILVKNDGIYELSADLLRKNGVPISAIDVRTFRLFEHNRQVALSVTNEHHRTLDPGDRLLFFGTALRGDDGRPLDFTETNCYWLTWGDSTGVRTAIVSGERREDPTLFRTTRLVHAESYNDTLHCEKDELLIWLGSIADVPATELTDVPGTDPFGNSMWYWGVVGTKNLTTFTFSCPSPVKRSGARIRAALMGMSSIDSITPDHTLEFFINDKPAGEHNRHTWDGQRYTVFESDTFSSDLLEHGENRLTVQSYAPRSADRSALDWIEIIYTRGYEALDGVADFRSQTIAAGALTEYTIDGFDSPDIDLWDVTRNRRFTAMAIEQGSGSNRGMYRLSFQDSVSYPVRYIAQPQNRRITDPQVYLDTIAGGWDTLCACDYLVISVDSFRTELQPLLDLHEKRGLRTAFVTIDDIYNRFTAGITDPEAIRLMLKYLQERGHIPHYLLLGGDCTHDLYKKRDGRTIVPTHLSRIPGWGPGADDGYFTLVNDGDLFPDCSAGRFPAQNRTEMRSLVDKTVRYMKEPDMSYWRDHLLLLGGGGEEFTRFNDRAQNDIVGNAMQVFRMDADPASPWYREGTAAKQGIADRCNTGMYVVNFSGHGGGNIWSDNDFFSYDDLSLLHNGQWRGGRLPIVLSFTCLTGFFESTDYRSLGEEFLRRDRDGAIAFYGASAYTSQLGNDYMNGIFLEELFSGTHATVGDLVNYGEISMLARYRSQYLSLVQQYNLLGDPALALAMVPDTLHLEAVYDSSVHALAVFGRSDAVRNGNLHVAIVNDDDVIAQTVRTFTGDTFTCRLPVKANAPPLAASVRGYVWNDSVAVKCVRNFIKDTLAITSVRLDPQFPCFDDTVQVRCTIQPIMDDSTAVQFYCMYAVTSGDPARAAFTGMVMSRADDGVWYTTQPITPGFGGDVNARLLVYFRMTKSGGTLQSTVLSFALRGRPDLIIQSHAIPLRWTRDSLSVSLTVQNIGNAAAAPFATAVCWKGDDGIDDTIARVMTTDSLACGAYRMFEVTIPDTSGTVSYYAAVDPSGAVAEVAEDNNRLDATGVVWRAVLRSRGDTLKIDSGRTVIVPADSFERTHTVFIIADTVGAATPLVTRSVWSSALHGHGTRWLCSMRPGQDEGDSLYWRGTYPVVAGDSGTLRGALMVYDTMIALWRCSDGGRKQMKEGTFSATTAAGGWYAPAALADNTPPELMVTVNGKTLTSIDYAAKDHPFTVLLADPSSINPASVMMFVNGQTLAAPEYSGSARGPDLRSISVSAYPKAQRRIDSLEVRCSDLAGNAAKQLFAYIPGADLSIRSFTCHPNPFTARKNGDGSIAKTRFAFLLTDIANSVTLSIFTASGKKIWEWSGRDFIGYQQVEWDGRDHDGYRIANGTYYAKLVVGNDRKKAVKIIRIAKLEGF